jgi:glycosyltransferase involved in cell wall biosynthesis
MHLLLIVDSYTPDINNAASRLMRELGQAFVSLGQEVTLLVPSPSAQKNIIVSYEDDLRVVRVRSWHTKNKNYLLRGLSELSLPFILAQATGRLRALDPKIDAIVWYAPSIFLSPLVIWLKLLFKARALLILRDIFPDWALQAGVLKRGPSAFFLSHIAHLQYRIADVIAVQASGDLVFLPDQLSKAKSIVLSNWASALPMQLSAPHTPNEESKAQSTIGAYILEPWFREKKILVVGGALGPAQDPMNLVRLARYLSSRTDAVLLVLCDHPDPLFTQECASLPPGVVIVKASMPLYAYDHLLRHAYAGIISLNAALETHNIPGRYLSHLAAGLPTIASVNANNELIEMIQTSKSGFGHSNGDDAALYASVAQLLDNQERRNAMAISAAEFSLQFSPQRAAETVLEALQTDLAKS